MRFLLALIAVSPLIAIEFNRDVRPILSDRCYACHGPDNATRKANFRLDRDPGEAAIRKVVDRITTSNSGLRMPPAYLGHEPLKPAEIEVIKRWASEGGRYQQHWSFIAPVKASVPDGRNAIDYFVRKRLAEVGLTASPQADKETLLRRVSLDLTGLPPSLEERAAFLKDESPNAYSTLVDRLLARRSYAERMTIRWLEAARYADTNGYQTDGERSMWRWRDWVLNAFDRNMPFDRFTIEQLAGDLLPNPTREQLIATGFNRNHRTTAEGGIIDEEFRVEYVADRTETTSTVWLGLTTGCARCHDHKYDPITQREFYQLFAFFNQVPEKGFVFNFGNEEPYIKAPTEEMESRQRELENRVSTLRANWNAEASRIESDVKRFQPDAGWLPFESLVFRHAGKAFHGEQGIDAGYGKTKLTFTDPFTFKATVQTNDQDGAILSKSEDYWEGTGHGLYLVNGKLRLHIVFRWTDLGMRVETAAPVDLSKSRQVIATYDGKRKPEGVKIYVDGVAQELKVLFNELSWPIESKEPFRIGSGGGKHFRGEIRDVAVWKRSLSSAEIAAISGHDDEMRRRLAYLDKKHPKALVQFRAGAKMLEDYQNTIPTVMVMKDQPGIRKSYLLKRGAYDQHGEEVQPEVPAALPRLDSEPSVNRLALARWIVSKNNPLTARVTVNRYWQMLFGAGLVKTVEDFGSQGEWPLYPELLDWLAVEFVESGWDVKHILKLIVSSETYKQSSRFTPELLSRDPENRLYARATRLRLSPEEVRDQALSVSGLLIDKFGGPSVKPPQPPGLWQELAGGKEYKPDNGEGRYRRSIYTYWRRTIQPPSMVTFDSPTRETCIVRETRTNTPLQALNLMNDEVYVEASEHLAKRMAKAPDPIAEGYMLVLSRDPHPKERELMEAAQKRFGDWTPVASMLLNLDEAVTRQ